jgi:hypothetical protein
VFDNLLDDETLNDFKLARYVLSNSENSIVVVQNNKIWKKKKGEGIRPFLETIEEMGDDLNGSIIGNRSLGRASALLCRYVKSSGVYSPQGTKTGIAILIIGGIPCQVDQLIPQITNQAGDGVCSFEQLLKNVESPDEAYNILCEKVL